MGDESHKVPEAAADHRAVSTASTRMADESHKAPEAAADHRAVSTSKHHTITIGLRGVRLVQKNTSIGETFADGVFRELFWLVEIECHYEVDGDTICFVQPGAALPMPVYVKLKRKMRTVRFPGDSVTFEVPRPKTGQKAKVMLHFHCYECDNTYVAERVRQLFQAPTAPSQALRDALAADLAAQAAVEHLLEEAKGLELPGNVPNLTALPNRAIFTAGAGLARIVYQVGKAIQRSGRNDYVGCDSLVLHFDGSHWHLQPEYTGGLRECPMGTDPHPDWDLPPAAGQQRLCFAGGHMYEHAHLWCYTGFSSDDK